MKKLLYIDLFCGAGGTSTGVESATLNGQKCAHVIACVNHDPHAIASHLANHPEAKHYTEDIRTLDLTTLVEHTAKMRAGNPGALLVLWASLECTNFSRAKGGLPRDADSRTLAEHLFRYIDALNPDYIQIENVREFQMWGDLDENGRPVSKDAGKLYLRWVKNVCSRGYDFDHRILNSADFGAYTSRERFFGIFARKGLPIVFPEPTHSKAPEKDLFGESRPWKPVKDVLDLNDYGRSIFNRDKPLCEKTLARIYAGLLKFVAGEKKRNTQFLSKAFSGDPAGKNISIDGPAGTITCKDHHTFITTYYGNGSAVSAEEPAPTLTTKDRLSLINLQFLANYYSKGGSLGSISKPSGTITTVPKQNLVTAQFLVNPQFESAGSSIEKPCFTLIAKMDKRPPQMVSTIKGVTDIPVYDTDSEMTVKIKEFMATYGISDIFMRMLKIPELKKIMGFPEDYVLVGTQAEQKKYIGNAVETHVASALCASLSAELNRIAS